MKEKIIGKIAVSNRHVHLTEEIYNELFDEPLQIKRPLNQVGEFAAFQTVTLKTEKAEIPNVRIIGPFRKYNQVEISRTDAYALKLNPPVRASGDLKGASVITIETEKGKIERPACILADRHIHITKEERKNYNLLKDSYSVKIPGEKGGIFDNVMIKESEKSYYEMHIDTDDANAFGIKSGQEVEILN